MEVAEEALGPFAGAANGGAGVGFGGERGGFAELGGEKMGFAEEGRWGKERV